MNSVNNREKILRKLRTAQPKFSHQPPEERRHMVPLSDTTPDGLRTRFITEAEKLGAKIYQPPSDSDAIATILNLTGEDKNVLAWDFAFIPLDGLQPALTDAGITVADVRDDTVRVGITGCEAALAATGSLVVATGNGKARSASLLPVIHIAVVRASQLLEDFESWMAQQRRNGLDAFRATANIVVISGASRTADIEKQIVRGIHGPEELVVVLS